LWGIENNLLTDEDLKDILSIHNVKYCFKEGETSTFYMISDLIKMPKLYWMMFTGHWEFLETMENILKYEYDGYVYLVTH